MRSYFEVLGVSISMYEMGSAAQFNLQHAHLAKQFAYVLDKPINQGSTRATRSSRECVCVCMCKGRDRDREGERERGESDCLQGIIMQL